MSSNYFTFFPKINYDIDKDGTSVFCTDLTRRFRIKEIVLSRAINFYDYLVKEEERPDVVAHKIYGDSKLDWLVLMINEVFDPFWEWPMGYYDFVEYIKGKYGSYVNAVETVHHYEKIVQHEEMLTDGTRIPERVVVIDSSLFHMIPEVDRRIVYCYNWEDQQNEKRRNIKLLDGGYLPQILDEAKSVLGT